MIRCCKDCKERHPACWDSCEKYKAEKAEYDELNARIRKDKELKSGLDEQRIKAMQRIMKEGRKHK